MRILVYNDPHIADKPPLGRVDDYTTSIYEKLLEIREMAFQWRTNATLCTGDIFHQKRPNRVSHRLVGQLIYLFSSWPDEHPHWVVPGNHDLSSEGLDSLSKQPLGVLAKAGVITPLVGPVVFKNTVLIGRPWDAERSSDPEYYVLAEEEEEIINKFRVRPAVILVAHGPILPPGAQRKYDSVNVTALPLDGIDVVLAGHIHEDLGVTVIRKTKKAPTHKLFANIGSISRISRTQSNLSRGLHVLLLEVDDEIDEASSYGAHVKLTRHGLSKVLPAGEVFEDRPLDEEGVSDEIQQFVGTIAGGLQAEEMTLDEVLAELGDSKSSAAQLAKHYLEEAGL